MYTRYIMDVHKEREERHEVGVRDLRRQLSRWLGLAAQGHEVVVTDRGKPVARIIGVEGATALRRLIDEGLVQQPEGRRVSSRDIRRVTATGGGVAELVAEQRT